MRVRHSVDLTNCDREPIHIPGSIQPHGFLLACDAGLRIVQRHSSNLAAISGYDGLVNGEPIESIIGEQVAGALRNALTSSADPTKPSLVFGQNIRGRIYDVTVHRHGQDGIAEFEPAIDDGAGPLELARSMTVRVASATDVEKLVQIGARLVRGILGYDRVMVYQFQSDGAGKVISEVKRPDLESFLGQYFPASDIPQQARALYLRNTLRIISDVDYRPVALVPVFDDAGEPLDLSQAHLRSVSPVHCEYLRNMGVSASMSISIIIDGQLWGLIACHHYSPRILSMAHRVAAEMFGHFFSLHLSALRQRQKLDTATAARGALDRFLTRATRSTDLGELLGDSLMEFAALMPCDGIGLWIGEQWMHEGTAVSETLVPSLAALAGSIGDGAVWSTHEISRRMRTQPDQLGDVAGVVAIPLSKLPRDYLFLFRKEIEQTLDWAGNPDKSYETGPLGDRLTPRKSFAIWKETVRGQSEPWSEADLEIAEAARAALVEVALHHNELMAEERSKAEVRQRMLNDELNHRVKNILAIIQSLVGQPSREPRSLEDYVSTLKGRIHALSVAHDQVIRGEGGGSLRKLIEAELLPYRTSASRVDVDGQGVMLDVRAFSVLALVLHEMATNAAKYGALSQPGGRLEVTWRVLADGACELRWQEMGGPPVSPPRRQGFGTTLIQRSIPFDLGGEADVRYEAHGLSARFLLPARHLGGDLPEDEGHAATLPVAAAPAAVDGATRILLVEDQMLIAMDVEMMLEDRGFADVTTAGSVDEALGKLAGFTPSAAVLDFNLGDRNSATIATELMRRGVPFVFATGYGDTGIIPAEFRDVPVVRKPYNGDVLVEQINKVLGRA